LTAENSGIKNTYLEDFAFLEGLEPETGGIIDKAIMIANEGGSTNEQQKSSDKKK